MLRHAVEGVIGDDPHVAAPQLQLGQHGEQEKVGGLDAADGKGVAAETQLVEVSERQIIKFRVSVPSDDELMTLQFLNGPFECLSNFAISLSYSCRVSKSQSDIQKGSFA